VAVPTLVFAFGVAHFSREVHNHLHRWRPHLETASIVLLMFMGAGTAAGWLKP